MIALHGWLLAAALTGAHVAPPAWELLGSRRVTFAAERDVIHVGAVEGRFTALKVQVQGGNIDMYDVRITFGDGETWSPATRLVFREGSWSRTLDLPGRARVIRTVEFRYRSQLRRGRATIEVFGLSAPVAPARPAFTAPAGWDHVGTRRVNFAVDHDIVAAGTRGLFRRLLIHVEDGALEMYDVTVTFANGSQFSPRLRLRFDENTRSRVIDLPGAARVIRRIDFKYRSLDRRPAAGPAWTAGPRERAVVHVYGRR
jgi:hypothetical protein